MTLCLSLNCEVDIVLALCLVSSEVVFVERGVVYSQVVFSQMLSGGSLCEKSCADAIVKILLCEGGGRRAVCSNLETYFCVCV